MSELKSAAERVKLVADGGTINGTYRQTPMTALQSFRDDLHLILDAIKDGPA